MDQRAKEQTHLSIVYQQLLARKSQLDLFLAEKKAAHLQDLRQVGSDVRLNFDSITDSLDTYVAIESKNREIDQMNLSLAAAEKELASVERLLKSPYFGKLTMRFTDEDEAEDFYFGINGFTNTEKKGVIYDWRSPVAAVFYENSLGPSAYMVNDQQIDVYVRDRWQFMIDHDQLLQLFDTSIAIQDDVLLTALSTDHTQEMKDITASIQQEQNEIIRDTKHQNILVHGVAGSGKISIAMQRVAFLLYHYRQHLTADNALILSPNTGFTQYISQVLPSLGEKNLRTMTLNQLIGQLSDWSIQNEAQFFSTLVKAPSKEQQVLRQHACVSFLKQQAAASTVKMNISFLPIRYKKKIIFSAAVLQDLYQATPETYTMQERLQAVKQQLILLWQQRLETNAKNSTIQDQVRTLTEEEQQQKLGGLNQDEQPDTIRHAASMLLKRKYRKVDQAIEQLHWVDQETLAEDLYLQYSKKPLTHTTPNDIDHHIFYMTVRHLFIQKIAVPKLTYLFIDEVQDYTPAQIEFLLLLFPFAAYTFVGDENQAIFPASITFDELTMIFRQANLPIHRYDMLTSYRSSGAITALFARLQTKNNHLKIAAVRPIGKSISYIDNLADSQLIKWIKKSVLPLTILTKSEADAIQLQKEFSDESTASKMTILPIYLAKGREFQHVLLLTSMIKTIMVH